MTNAEIHYAKGWKMDPGKFWETPVRTTTLEARGPNICIDPRPACRHVKCVLGGARGSRALLFSCLPDVCFYDDVTCKREPWPGVSRETHYLFRHAGPKSTFGRIAFGRVIFASFFVTRFCIVCSSIFDWFWPPLGLHMLASFSMFFALLFRASILHSFVINFVRMFMYCLKYFCWSSWSYLQLANPSKSIYIYITFAWLTLSQTHVCS